MGLPTGWNNYKRVGKPVHGTHFIAFKVPLKEGVNRGCNVTEENQLYPKKLVELIPKLGLIIDLTNTTKYYNPDEFTKLGVQYKKVMVEGQQIPKYECYIKFKNAVNDYLASDESNDKLIGVHCTHGLNRSGFMICRYMIQEMKTPPLEAIAAFEVARGHKMERENYIEKLKYLNDNGTKFPKIPSLSIDTETEKGTQTSRGFWIDEKKLQQNHRIPSACASEMPEQIQQVQLVGDVHVHRSNLIPDGRGGYFVHVTKKDIQRHESSSRRNPYQMPNHRMDGSNQSNPMDRSHPRKRSHQNIPYQRQYQARPNMPYTQRPPSRHTGSSMYMDNSLPLGSNNMAEDLLRMQHINMNVNVRGGRPY